ncbi:NAD(P)H-binding protein [Isoptericola sp. NEAU-Y5]|uniref:NAD(P)H-binding protein n=1 Tax=Isoptericola luteus TaxID=2879484 RepID=A0ABS7ZGE2_9MICO|nr:NmrA family NAD(P)-binding protein [Isoptericola sp. NEAU-Y5]MCA5894092.1 NAD(P)H-binding protein [Isoptericola sp. NEAU-Y5]
MVRWSADGLVAVTGASGRLGSRLAFRLAAEGARQRLVVRDPRHEPRLADGRRLPECEVVIADGYDDTAGMRAAFDGVRTVFLVSARESVDRVDLHAATIDAAVAAGVERLVYTSFTGAAPDAVFTFARDHWHTEQHLARAGERSGLRWTVLRDNLYHHALTTFVGDDGVIRGPAGTGRVASVSHDDVADVATAVILDERPQRHDAATYEVSGPQALTLAEVAQTLTTATGRRITYHAETEEEAYASRATSGAEPFELAGWVTSYTAIAAGQLAHVSADVGRLVGRPARSLAQWLDDYPAEWAHLRR